METPSYSKTYYHANRERILTLQKERRKDVVFREKMKIYYRNYYKENRNKILEQSRTRRGMGTKGTDTTKLKAITIRRGGFIVRFD
tara:strand:+ start:976 stop:1233 length:258 start_codon:yes stop_codon:yes gene_type:complete